MLDKHVSVKIFAAERQRNTGMDKAPQVKLHSTAHYFLEGLNDIGVEYLFSNFGTDHAPLIEEMARWKKDGRRYPKVLNCPHENTAMHMAASCPDRATTTCTSSRSRSTKPGSCGPTPSGNGRCPRA